MVEGQERVGNLFYARPTKKEEGIYTAYSIHINNI